MKHRLILSAFCVAMSIVFSGCSPEKKDLSKIAPEDSTFFAYFKIDEDLKNSFRSKKGFDEFVDEFYKSEFVKKTIDSVCSEFNRTVKEGSGKLSSNGKVPSNIISQPAKEVIKIFFPKGGELSEFKELFNSIHSGVVYSDSRLVREGDGVGDKNLAAAVEFNDNKISEKLRKFLSSAKGVKADGDTYVVKSGKDEELYMKVSDEYFLFATDKEKFEEISASIERTPEKSLFDNPKFRKIFGDASKLDEDCLVYFDFDMVKKLPNVNKLEMLDALGGSSSMSVDFNQTGQLKVLLSQTQLAKNLGLVLSSLKLKNPNSIKNALKDCELFVNFAVPPFDKNFKELLKSAGNDVGEVPMDPILALFVNNLEQVDISAKDLAKIPFYNKGLLPSICVNLWVDDSSKIFNSQALQKKLEESMIGKDKFGGFDAYVSVFGVTAVKVSEKQIALIYSKDRENALKCVLGEGGNASAESLFSGMSDSFLGIFVDQKAFNDFWLNASSVASPNNTTSKESAFYYELMKVMYKEYNSSANVRFADGMIILEGNTICVPDFEAAVKFIKGKK